MKRDIEIVQTKEKKKWLDRMPPYIKEYIRSIQESKGLSTQIAYLKDYSLFLSYLANLLGKESMQNITVDDLDRLTENDINVYLEHITNYTKVYDFHGQLRERTVHNSKEGKARKAASIKVLFKYLDRKGYIRKNISEYVEIKTTDKRFVKDRLSPEDIIKLIDTILKGRGLSGSRNKALHNTHKYRDVCIIITLAYTGIRISELVQLDLKDLNLKEIQDESSMIVIRKGDKMEKLFLSSPVVQAMTNYIQKERKSEGNPALLLSNRGTRMVPRTINALLSVYRERAGLNVELTPHTFRRTFATKMLEETGDLQLVADLLGHESIETTRRHYTVTSEKKKQRAIANFKY